MQNINYNNSKPPAEVEKQRSLPKNILDDSTSPNAGTDKKLNMPFANPQNEEWSTLEQKLLFALMLKHFASWQKYAKSLLDKTKLQIDDFVRKSLDRLKYLKLTLNLKTLENNSGESGKFWFFYYAPARKMHE